MNCQAMTKNGKPCPARVHHDSGYCWMHDPAIETERNAARKKGGAARRGQLRGREIPQLQHAEDVRGYLNRVLADTEKQLIPPNTARAIANLCRVQLDTISAAELEADRERQRLETEERRRRGY